jgi:hypothetical protein
MVTMLHIEGNTATAKWNRTIVDDGERRATRQRTIDCADHLHDRRIRAKESLDRGMRHERTTRHEAELPPQQVAQLRSGSAHRVGRPQGDAETDIRLSLECLTGHEECSGVVW